MARDLIRVPPPGSSAGGTSVNPSVQRLSDRGSAPTSATSSADVPAQVTDEYGIVWDQSFFARTENPDEPQLWGVSPDVPTSPFQLMSFAEVAKMREGYGNAARMDIEDEHGGSVVVESSDGALQEATCSYYGPMYEYENENGTHIRAPWSTFTIHRSGATLEGKGELKGGKCFKAKGDLRGLFIQTMGKDLGEGRLVEALSDDLGESPYVSDCDSNNEE